MATKIWVPVGISAAGLVAYIGWSLLTSQVFATQTQVRAEVEQLRAERANDYVRKDELIPLLQRMESKMDKMSDDIVSLKVEAARRR